MEGLSVEKSLAVKVVKTTRPDSNLWLFSAKLGLLPLPLIHSLVPSYVSSVF